MSSPRKKVLQKSRLSQVSTLVEDEGGETDSGHENDDDCGVENSPPYDIDEDQGALVVNEDQNIQFDGEGASFQQEDGVAFGDHSNPPHEPAPAHTSHAPLMTTVEMSTLLNLPLYDGTSQPANGQIHISLESLQKFHQQCLQVCETFEVRVHEKIQKETREIVRKETQSLRQSFKIALQSLANPSGAAEGHSEATANEEQSDSPSSVVHDGAANRPSSASLNDPHHRLEDAPLDAPIDVSPELGLPPAKSGHWQLRSIDDNDWNAADLTRATQFSGVVEESQDVDDASTDGAQFDMLEGTEYLCDPSGTHPEDDSVDEASDQEVDHQTQPTQPWYGKLPKRYHSRSISPQTPSKRRRALEESQASNLNSSSPRRGTVHKSDLIPPFYTTSNMPDDSLGPDEIPMALAQTGSDVQDEEPLPVGQRTSSTTTLADPSTLAHLQELAQDQPTKNMRDDEQFHDAPSERHADALPIGQFGNRWNAINVSSKPGK